MEQVQLNPTETVMHLLFYCPFAKDCWGILNFHFADNLSIPQIFQAWRTLLNVSFSFDIFKLLCWGIWMMRNDVIFRNKNPSVENLQKNCNSGVSPVAAQNESYNYPHFRIMDSVSPVIFLIFFVSFYVS